MDDIEKIERMLNVRRADPHGLRFGNLPTGNGLHDKDVNTCNQEVKQNGFIRNTSVHPGEAARRLARTKLMTTISNQKSINPRYN